MRCDYERTTSGDRDDHEQKADRSSAHGATRWASFPALKKTGSGVGVTRVNLVSRRPAFGIESVNLTFDHLALWASCERVECDRHRGSLKWFDARLGVEESAKTVAKTHRSVTAGQADASRAGRESSLHRPRPWWDSSPR